MNEEINELRAEIASLIDALTAEGSDEAAAVLADLVRGHIFSHHPYAARSEAGQELLALADHLDGEGKSTAVEALMGLMLRLVGEEEAAFAFTEVA